VIASIVNTTALAKVVIASLVAGVGVTAVFALGVYGAARTSDMRRANRARAAAAYLVLAVGAVTVTVAAIVYGVVLTTEKA
jgi:hypothetical protein